MGDPRIIVALVRYDGQEPKAGSVKQFNGTELVVEFKDSRSPTAVQLAHVSHIFEPTPGFVYSSCDELAGVRECSVCGWPKSVHRETVRSKRFEESAPIIKRCGCGRSYTEAQFAQLPFIGKREVDGEILTLRVCSCGSTIATTVCAKCRGRITGRNEMHRCRFPVPIMSAVERMAIQNPTQWSVVQDRETGQRFMWDESAWFAIGLPERPAATTRSFRDPWTTRRAEELQRLGIIAAPPDVKHDWKPSYGLRGTDEWCLEVWQDTECVRAEVNKHQHEPPSGPICWHVEITTGDLDMILGVCFSEPEKARAAAEQIIDRWLRGARA